MIATWSAAVYFMCLLASLFCAVLLFRAWRHTRSSLLLWTALSFLFFSLNNLALVADVVIFPDVALWPLRTAFTLMALGVLIFGFVWESNP